MTMPPPANRSDAPSAQLVGKIFVHQYYHILHESPESGYMFYHDSSVLSRPEPNGVLESVTSIQGINDKILSLDCKSNVVEIINIDAQDSFNGGVLVLVNGYLTGKDNLRRAFSQLFFLAPQEKGYFIHNDVFRYVDENEPLEMGVDVDKYAESSSPASLTQDPDPAHASNPLLDDDRSTSPMEANSNDGVYHKLHNEEELVAKVDDTVKPHIRSTQKNVALAAVQNSLIVEEDGQGRSYASMVNAVEGNIAHTAVSMKSNNRRVVPANADSNWFDAFALCPETSAPSNSNTSEIVNGQDKGYSIHIRNLPMSATIHQVEAVFKKFGSIKPDGVQVRSRKQQGFCFGFVEFESLDSMHSAIQASPVTVGRCQAIIEEKKSKTQVVDGREIFPSNRGQFHSDRFRGQRDFRGGIGYGNHEFGKQIGTYNLVRGQGQYRQNERIYRRISPD
ncbi:hypothetical protein Sjap_024081 [Stephania japonica]|uniref:G3BP-like protein n=1 Tax=Stephania japonica TaxID=461633 RepID=A0AAP0ECX7_9MAGN